MKKLISFIMCFALLVALSGCNSNSEKPNVQSEPSLTDPITGEIIKPIDPNVDYSISAEEFMQRLVASGETTEFSLTVMSDFETSCSTTIIQNDGVDKMYQHKISNLIHPNGAFEFQENTEQFFDYANNLVYTMNGMKFNTQPFTPELMPQRQTLQYCIDALVCPGFYEKLIINIPGFEYNAIKDEYYLVDFYMEVGNETRYFENVTVRMLGKTLHSIECKAGSQFLYIEIFCNKNITIDLPK